MAKRKVQTEFAFKTWGGKRKGAGRPPKRCRAGMPHVARQRFTKLSAVHVTQRLVFGCGTLRRRDAYFAVRKATRAVLKREDFRIVHVSLEYEHLHLIVEAESDEALTRGVQAFEISAAQHLNRALGRIPGKVFDERYHSTVLESPTQTRNAIAYVLGNWRHHLQDRSEGEEGTWDIDYYSSAPNFDGWQELAEGARLQYRIPDDMRLFTSQPHTWLLRVGWRKAGPIRMHAVPGKFRGP